MINLIVVDGDDLSRLALSGVFEKSDSINLLQVIDTSSELEDLPRMSRVDVVLFDYTSKSFEINHINTIKNKFPGASIMSITAEQNVLSLQHALAAGVQGCVKKSCSVREIQDCVGALYNGESFFCGDILDLLSENSIEVDGLEERVDSCEPVSISKRELEVIRLIASGYTNPMIAKKLFLSNHTVNAHKKNIFNKLGVNNTTSVVMYAVKNGIIDPNQFLFPSDVQMN